MKLNADGTGTIVTGAQENGSGAVMALPLLVAEVLGMEPDGLLDPLPGHRRGPVRRGSSGSQTTFNNGRAVVAAAREVREQLLDLAAEELEVAREDLELADGHVRVVGSPTGRSRSRSSPAPGTRFHRQGLGPTVPRTLRATPRAASGASASSRSSSRRSSPTRPASRSTARPASSASSRSPPRTTPARSSTAIGADGQVYGGVVMGIGQALLEGSQLDDDGRQRNPHLLDYKLVTAADAPRIDVAWIETPAQNGGPQGSKGVGEPPTVPTPGAIANAIARVDRRRVRELPMTPERVWAAAARRERVTPRSVAATVDEALAAMASGRAAGRRRDRPRRRRAPGQGAAPGEHRRHPPARRAARHRGVGRRRLRLGALVTHAEIASTPSSASGSRRSPTPPPSSARTRPGRHGTIGGNLMNASPAMEAGGPLMVFGATVTLRSGSGERRVPVAELLTGPGTTVAAPDELSPRSRSRCRRGNGQRLRPARVPAADGDRGRRRDRGVSRVADPSRAPASRSRRWRRRSGSCRRRRRRSSARTAARRPCRPRRAGGGRAAEPISDVRASADYRRAMAEVLARRALGAAVARARGETVPVPASPPLHGGAA